MEPGLTYIDFDNGIILSCDTQNGTIELNDLISAWHGFKSRGGNIESACYKLGYLHKYETTTNGRIEMNKKITEIPIEQNLNFCHRMVGGVAVFSCATSCAGLSNCKNGAGGYLIQKIAH